MLWVLVQIRRLILVVLALVALLLSPLAWIELSCRGKALPQDYASLLPPEHRRAESRTYTTWPEWHIVHAYDDYARVIATGDPHDYGYVRSVIDFWRGLCPMSRKAAEHGGFTSESKMTIYTIGVSFTAELLAKAAYEETLGRIATLVRGAGRAPLDDLSARQAADYAVFLRQTPWYRWDFATDRAALAAAATDAPRDIERRWALGTEFAVKGAYGAFLRGMVDQMGEDETEIRSVVAGLAPDVLAALHGVTVIAERPEGIEIETPRYRAFTGILATIAAAGGEVVEIAGNDDLLMTVLSDAPDHAGAAFSFRRQGHGDWRHLVEVKVADLAPALRALAAGPARLEHIHDY